eukprot:8378406-Pyramimonas_sp.AAC.1
MCQTRCGIAAAALVWAGRGSTQQEGSSAPSPFQHGCAGSATWRRRWKTQFVFRFCLHESIAEPIIDSLKARGAAPSASTITRYCIAFDCAL